MIKLTCPSCSAGLNVAPNQIPSQGANILCPCCSQIFLYGAPNSLAEENNAKTLPPSPTEQNSSSEIQTPQHAQTEPSPLSFNLYGTFEEDENDPSHCELHVNIPPPIKTLPPSKTLPSSFPGIQTPQQIQTEPPPLSFDLYDAFEEDDLSQNPFEKYAPKNLPLGKNILPHSTPPPPYALSIPPPSPSPAAHSLHPLSQASLPTSTEFMGLDSPPNPLPRACSHTTMGFVDIPPELLPPNYNFASAPTASALSQISQNTTFAPLPNTPPALSSLPSAGLKPITLTIKPNQLLHAAAIPNRTFARLKPIGMLACLCLLASATALYSLRPRFLFPHPAPTLQKTSAPILPPLPSLNEMQSKLHEGTRQALRETASHPEVLSQGSLEQALLWCRSVFSLALFENKPEGLGEALAFMSKLPPHTPTTTELLKTQAVYALLSNTPEDTSQAIQTLTALPQKDGESTWLLAWAYFKQDNIPKAAQLLGEDSKIFEPRRQKILGDMALAMKKPMSAIGHYKKAYAHPPLQAEMDLAIAKAWFEANRPKEALAQLSSWENAPAQASATMAQNAWELIARAQLELELYVEAALTLEKLKTDNSLYAELMAELWVATKEPQKAVALLEEEMKKKPENLRLAKPYVQALLLSGKHAETENFAKQLLKKNPENVSTRLFAATVFQQLGQLEFASAMVEKTLSLEPQNIEAKRLWATLHQRLRQYSTAQNFLEKATAEFSNGATPNEEGAATLWAALGALFEETHNLPKAKTAYAQALLKQPNKIEALTGLGRMALAEGNAAELLQYAEKIQSINPRSPEGAWLGAHLLWAEGKKEEALEKLEWALRKNSNQVDFWLSKAQMALEDKRLSNANEALEHARQLNPSLTAVNHLSGLTYEAQGDFNKAQTYFQKASETDKQNPIYLLAQSRVLMSSRRFQEAAALLGRIIKEYPANVEAPLLLGRYYQERYRFKIALPLFEKALDIEPNNLEALRGAADCLLELTRWSQATAMLQRLLTQTPADVQVAIRLGRASFEAGHYTQAVHWYQKSLEQIPNNPSVLLNLGWAFKELGRKQDAIWAFKNYLQLDSMEPNKKMLEDEIGFLSQRH